jgi:hypothetical protein
LRRDRQISRSHQGFTSKAAWPGASGPDGLSHPEDICSLRILFIGDVVGKTGRNAVVERLPGLIRDWSLDLVVVNG